MTYVDIFPELKGKEANLTITKVTKSNLIDLYHKQIDRGVQFVYDNLIKKPETYGLFINPIEIDDENKFAKNIKKN